MANIGKTHHVLAYIAVAVAVVSVILAGISRLIMLPIVITSTSFMSVATVALLFAIYFLVEGVIYAAKKAK